MLNLFASLNNNACLERFLFTLRVMENLKMFLKNRPVNPNDPTFVHIPNGILIHGG